MFSKKQIADAVVKFIHHDLIDEIDDAQLKMVLCMVKKSIMDDEDSLDGFLKNPIISTVIKNNDGMYDITAFAGMLKRIIGETHEFPITVPSVPLILSHERKIKMSEADIDSIIGYLEEKPAEQTV